MELTSVGRIEADDSAGERVSVLEDRESLRYRKLVSDAATKLESMLTAARSSNELMSSIAKESREQASSIDEVNVDTNQLC